MRPSRSAQRRMSGSGVPHGKSTGSPTRTALIGLTPRALCCWIARQKAPGRCSSRRNGSGIVLCPLTITLFLLALSQDLAHLEDARARRRRGDPVEVGPVLGDVSVDLGLVFQVEGQGLVNQGQRQRGVFLGNLLGGPALFPVAAHERV